MKPLNYQNDLHVAHPWAVVAGADEAGAGSLIGPVVAAAVILDPYNVNPDINDSKRLSPGKRSELNVWLKVNSLAYSVGINSVERIDQINILWARLEAMRKAVLGLKIAPECVLVDGDRKIPDLSSHVHQVPMVKGDAHSVSIAAASIVAKATRDEMMVKLGKKWQNYGLESNKGYWCKKIVGAIKDDGYIEGFHRKAFVKKIFEW
jgi:ribonuclease HII